MISMLDGMDKPSTHPGFVHLKCKNHPNLRWLRRDKPGGYLGFMGDLKSGLEGNPLAASLGDGVHYAKECDCPFSDLEVVK